MSASSAPPAGGSNMIGKIIAGVALLALLIAYFTVLNGFRHEGENRSVNISDKSNAGEDYIEINIKVVSVDPVKGDLITRLSFEPHGALAKDEFSPANDLTLLINSATGKQEHKFEKGKRMNPIDATLTLDGESSEYPFDSHEADLILLMTTPVQEKAEEPKEEPREGAESEPAPKQPQKASVYDSNEPVAMAVEFTGSVPGLKLDAEKDKESEVGYTGIEMTISRSTTVLFFSSFVMVLMLGLATMATGLMLRFWLGKRKVELAAMSLYGAMLFAFPALRNSQPGVPPIGTYSDYISFFWAEILIGICLLIIGSLWVIRRPS
ncbi:MAG: DUF4436 family protein [Acidobacteriota bacterium]